MRMSYSVFFKNGKTIQVIADNFNADYDKGYVRFSLDSRNVALFSFNSIIGFLQEAEEDENESDSV